MGILSIAAAKWREEQRIVNDPTRIEPMRQRCIAFLEERAATLTAAGDMHNAEKAARKFYAVRVCDGATVLVVYWWCRRKGMSDA